MTSTGHIVSNAQHPGRKPAPPAASAPNNALHIKPTPPADSAVTKPAPVASHTLPPQPARPSAMATAAPVKKAAPPAVTPTPKPNIPSVETVAEIALKKESAAPSPVATAPIVPVTSAPTVPLPPVLPSILPLASPPIPMVQFPSTVTTGSSVINAPISMHLGFDMSLETSPPTPTQHSSNGFPHIASSSAVKMEQSSPPLGMYSNGNSAPMATGVPSIFDPLPATSLAATTMTSHIAVKKEEKSAMPSVPQPAIGKPINDGLLNNTMPVEKKMTPPESTKTSAANFASAFKAKLPPVLEPNVKNASSWSSLAQASSPQNPSSSNSNTSLKSAMDSFNAFKKQAKEKLDRQRALIEQQEMRRHQKEQAERERMRMETERRQEREEEDALEKARKAVQEQQQQSRQEEVKPIVPEENHQGPSQQVPDKSAGERERQRLREQERRRREAMAGQIDMNMQSDLMAAFEESL